MIFGRNCRKRSSSKGGLHRGSVRLDAFGAGWTLRYSVATLLTRTSAPTGAAEHTAPRRRSAHFVRPAPTPVGERIALPPSKTATNGLRQGNGRCVSFDAACGGAGWTLRYSVATLLTRPFPTRLAEHTAPSERAVQRVRATPTGRGLPFAKNHKLFSQKCRFRLDFFERLCYTEMYS